MISTPWLRRSFATLSIPFAAACGAASPGLNQTSITCPPGRTLLDGVCASESVVDYVACVRAQGAELGGEKGQRVSAEAGTLAMKAGGAAEVRERLERRYAVSDQATLEIIRACAKSITAALVAGPVSATAVSDQATSLKSEDSRVPATVTFGNERDAPVQVLWRDYAGQETLYSTILPGQAVEQQTYLRHAWVFRDARSGHLVGSFVVQVASPPQTYLVR